MSEESDDRHVYELPICSAAPVPAGERRLIGAELIIPAQLQGLSVKRHCAPAFQIYGISCCRVEQLLAGWPGVPATLFADDVCAECARRRLPPELRRNWGAYHAGQPVTIEVENISAAAVRFESSIRCIDLSASMLPRPVKVDRDGYVLTRLDADDPEIAEIARRLGEVSARLSDPRASFPDGARVAAQDLLALKDGLLARGRR